MDLVALARHLIVICTLSALMATTTVGCKDNGVARTDAAGVQGAVDHAPVGVGSESAPTWQRYGDLIF